MFYALSFGRIVDRPWGKEEIGEYDWGDGPLGYRDYSDAKNKFEQGVKSGKYLWVSMSENNAYGFVRECARWEKKEQ